MSFISPWAFALALAGKIDTVKGNYPDLFPLLPGLPTKVFPAETSVRVWDRQGDRTAPPVLGRKSEKENL